MERSNEFQGTGLFIASEQDSQRSGSGRPMSRPSSIMNEDDYDYAIEIRPDDDYRKVAANVSHLRDFRDVSSPSPKPDRIVESMLASSTHNQSNSNSPVGQVLVESLNKYKSASVHYLSSMFSSPSSSVADTLSPTPSLRNRGGVGVGGLSPISSVSPKPDAHSDDESDDDQANGGGLESGLSMKIQNMHISAEDVPSDFVPTNTFLSRMGMLKQQKAWVEKARRRSSMSYLAKYNISDKAVHDKFLIFLFNGIHIRRHQAYHTSEMVYISSKDGGREMTWSKAIPRDLMNQRRRDGVHVDGTTNSVYAATQDSNGCSYCINFCSCGDDLLGGNAYRAANGRPVVNIISERDERNQVGKGSLTYNLGFNRSGSFLDFDVIAVHAACCEDPTYHGGVVATEAFRNSKDIYNPNLSFSIILRNQYSHLGFVTLDLECETEESYYVLFRGFRLLREETLVRKYREKLEADALAVASGPAQTTTFATVWESLKDKTTKPPKSEDPVDVLFAPSNSFDPLRYMIVGGGLLDESKTSASNNDEFGLVPPAQFLGWHTAGTQIWARLKMAGLDVKCVYSWDLKRVILKIRCPQWRLEEMAEFMHLKLKNRDGSLKRFKVARRDTFVSYGTNETLFRSSERQQIIDFIIRSKIKEGGAELDENTELGSHIVQRFPLHMISRLQEIRHGWVTFWKVSRIASSNYVQQLNQFSSSSNSYKSINKPQSAAGKAQAAALGIDLELGVDVSLVAAPWSPFSTPISVTCRKLTDSIENFMLGLLQQPLDHIAEYYGEDVAFYFAYLSYYTRWLIIPSIFGTGVFLMQVQSQKLDHWLCIPYAILVMLWACFMLAFWRQKSSLLAYRWGVLDYEVEETERPQFHGHYEYDDSSGEVRKVYSPWKRLLKYVITLPVITAATLGMLLIMSCVFSTQDKLYIDFAQGKELDYYPQFGILFGNFGGDSNGINTDSAFNNGQPVTTSSSSSFYLTSNSSLPESRQPWSMKITSADMNDANFWTVTFLYPCIYGIVVNLMAILFEILAISLNNFENHRTQTVYMNRLILKVFSFQFITVFTSLYYYAFFMRNREGAFLRMAVTIFSLMTVGQWWQAIVDVFTPALYHRIMLYRMKVNISSVNRKLYGAKEYVEFGLDSSTIGGGAATTTTTNNNSDPESISKEKIDEWKVKIDRRENYLEDARSKCWEEAIQMRYTTFSDYTNLVMQLGFVLLFSLVFPLAPLIACINNIILIRLGAYKICHARQRPIAQKVGGLGVWEDVLQIMSVVGILTNCGIMGYTSHVLRGFFAQVGDTGLVAILFAFEHLVLFFKYWLHKSVPRVPPTVQRAQARERRSVLNRNKKKKGKNGPNSDSNNNNNSNSNQDSRNHISHTNNNDNEQQYANMYFESVESDLKPVVSETVVRDEGTKAHSRSGKKKKDQENNHFHYHNDIDHEPEIEKYVSLKGESNRSKKSYNYDDFFSTNYFNGYENELGSEMDQSMSQSMSLSPTPSPYNDIKHQHHHNRRSPKYDGSEDHSYYFDAFNQENNNTSSSSSIHQQIDETRAGSPKTVRFSSGHDVVEFEKQDPRLEHGNSDSEESDDNDYDDEDEGGGDSVLDCVPPLRGNSPQRTHSQTADYAVNSILKKQLNNTNNIHEDFDSKPFPHPNQVYNHGLNADDSRGGFYKPSLSNSSSPARGGAVVGMGKQQMPSLAPNQTRQMLMQLQTLGSTQTQHHSSSSSSSSPPPLSTNRSNGQHHSNSDSKTNSGNNSKAAMAAALSTVQEKFNVIEQSCNNENFSSNSGYYPTASENFHSNSPNQSPNHSPNNTPRKRNVNAGNNSVDNNINNNNNGSYFNPATDRTDRSGNKNIATRAGGANASSSSPAKKPQ